MTHLDDTRLVDAIEGRLAPPDAAHLAACASCRSQLTDLDAALARVAAVDDPAPSPLFWEHFRARVSEAIESAPPPATRAGLGFRWIAAASAALTVAFVALAMMVPPREQALQPPALVTAAPATPELMDDVAWDVDGDEAWALVRAIADDLDYDAARAAGVAPGPGALERAAVELSASEQSALIQLLEQEMKRTDS